MQVLSAEADTAIFMALELWPKARALMVARWFEREWSGEKGSGWLESVDEEARNDSRDGMDQRCMLESGDPDRRKFDVGSTARHVVGWRWDCGVDTWRPVHNYLEASTVCTIDIFFGNCITSHSMTLPPSVPSTRVDALSPWRDRAMLQIRSGKGTTAS